MEKYRVKCVCLIFFVRFFSCFMEISTESRSKKTPTDAICSCCNWLFDWIKMEFSVCSAHPLICVCVFVCRWITLHLKGTSTATTTQKQNIRTMIDWLITAQANENARDEKICFVRSVATDWNGNYDTNRPKTNFNGKYSVSIYWYLHPNFGNRNRRSVTVNCWARICLRHTRIFVSPWSILAIQFI